MEKICVGKTIGYIKVESTNLILTALNSFHSHIKFIIEIEKDSVIPVFNVLVIKTLKRVHTTASSMKK